MSKKAKIINIVSNSLVFLLVIVGMIMMNLSISGGETKLAASGIEALKYFTVESNLFVAGTSLLSIIFIVLNKEYKAFSIIKYVSVCSVTVTFLTVMFYLGPVFGMLAMLEGANLFFHLIVPVLSILHLLILEPIIKESNFKYTVFSILPVGLYGIAYLANIGANNGYGKLQYDWYFFGSYGLGIGFLLFLIMLALSYAAGIGLYFGFTKVKKIS